ncbi:MAG: hypothetical protein Fur0040_00590 [Sideroxydans sp.]
MTGQQGAHRFRRIQQHRRDAAGGQRKGRQQTGQQRQQTGWPECTDSERMGKHQEPVCTGGAQVEILPAAEVPVPYNGLAMLIELIILVVLVAAVVIALRPPRQ